AGDAPIVPVAPRDPWSDGTGDAPAEPAAPAGGDAVARAMAHVTQLLDRPGAAEVAGYPAELVQPDDPGMALTPGTKPVLLVFYDDGDRASDLQAAQLLPLIMRLRERIVLVTVDRAEGAKRTSGSDELVLRYFDDTPTVAVLDAYRRARLLRSGRVDAASVEAAIADAIANPGEPDEGTDEAPLDLPASPDAAEPGVNPFDRPASAGEPERKGPVFSSPEGHTARAHAARLQSAPGDPSVPGYPRDLVPSAPAGRVLSPGVKPCVIIFYDDSVKASDLQAAAYLELLVNRRSAIDLVVIDVGPKARWDEDQKRVVRTYFNFYVPTTVVLTASRAPVKSWYSRVEASALEAALDQALGR
ncbi:MAG: hypothetical protein O2894_12150, partial [Planctomycetota bacterium]|nr:hypothetical protein [Planctomycetota bacterium]